MVTLSSEYDVDSFIFKDHSFDNVRLHLSLYPSYYMDQSVHKVLIHGHTKIQRQKLPIGLMSEEAQETRIKSLNNFSQKTTRRATYTDLINGLLVSSDPVISSLRKSTSRQSNHKIFPSDVFAITQTIFSTQYYCFINC